MTESKVFDEQQRSLVWPAGQSDFHSTSVRGQVSTPKSPAAPKQEEAAIQLISQGFLITLIP